VAWRIEEYRTAADESPVRAFIAALPPDAKAEAIALIKLAEILGNKLREPHSKALGEGLFELTAWWKSKTGFRPTCSPECGATRRTRADG